MPEKAFIALGSNIQPEHYLPRAIVQLEGLGRILAVSNAYQSRAIAAEPQPDYINAAIVFETTLSPLELRERLRQIEAELDRVRTADKYAARTIDMDIALYGSLILGHPLLQIPDEQIYQRPHLAVTLAECDPDFVHPQTGERLSAIAERLHDPALLTLRDDLDLTAGLNSPTGAAGS
ncbi:MAG: 2-amino-4-hydroxy-6-hydroxymethyldihydropteridine diphosphokinase [Anaerolineales bacterium]|nr:2-amino-4-hydroxy-6-hydroxymethyldihydropteridine diphosphokinase [Anaerolineales bacterium]